MFLVKFLIYLFIYLIIIALIGFISFGILETENHLRLLFFLLVANLT